MSRITIGVSKVYHNSGRFRLHRKKTKPVYKHFFMSDDYTENLTFGTEYVNSAKAQILKLKKRYKRKFICPECFNTFIGYVKNDRETVECPYCTEDN